MAVLSPPLRGLFCSYWNKPTDKATAEDSPKHPQHAVENRRKQSTCSPRKFSTCCEVVENRDVLPIL